ncbi:retrovirus-related pol polyprotein LINE-1, partial [Tanacetum coccineum]
MPDEWRLSEVIPIYKNNGDAQACNNYRGIKLLSHTMKLWERVIERRLRRGTRVLENQFGFMSGRSKTEAIYLLRSLMEKYRERQRDLYMAFLDLEKAYDSVQRELVWRTLIDKGTPKRYSRVIKDVYEGAKTRVRTTVGNTMFFSMEVGLHQGSAISPYLFTLILDELSRGIQESIPWCMIFVDDIMLIVESAEGLNNRLERWMEALEDNGLR